VVVTDHDIDIFDPAAMERALAYRVQPARDIIIFEGARGSHLDPSIQLNVTKGSLAALTAKWGIDATIPEGSDLSEYEAIEYPFVDQDGHDGSAALTEHNVTPDVLAERIVAFLTEPKHFYDVLKRFGEVPHRTVVQAWGLLRQADRLARETKTGKYLLKT
jgi:3-polyprenyl-4-hydroxybenzoate decarboxylase